MTNTRTYSPARVKNPTSIQHVVWLHPGQTLIVQLKTDRYPDAKLDVSTTNLKVLTRTEIGDYTQFLLIQDEKALFWSEYSTCHLGDIWVDSQETIARLSVMLVCTTPEKQNFVTIINPDCTDVRIKPQDVIEVVVYDQRFGDQDEWNWVWTPSTDSDIDLDLMGYESMNVSMWHLFYQGSSTDDPKYPYARQPRCEVEDNPLCRQHHFWFRLKGTVIPMLMNMGDLKQAGTLQFYGFFNRHQKMTGPDTEARVTLVVDLDQKYRAEVFKTLAIERQNSLRPVPAVQGLHCKPWMGRFNPEPVKSIKKMPIRDISFRLINSPNIEDGCDVIDAIPSNNDLVQVPCDSGDCSPYSHIPPVPSYGRRMRSKLYLPHGMDFYEPHNPYDWIE